MALPEKPYLSMADAASQLGCSTMTVWRRIQTNELESFKLNGKRCFRAEAVEEYLARQLGITKEAVDA